MIAINEIFPKFLQSENNTKKAYDDKDSQFSIPGYNYFHNSNGRGVGFFIKNSIEFIRYPELDKIFQPSLFCKILCSQGSCLNVGVLYRSPNSSPEENNLLIKQLETVTQRFKRKKEDLLILGDFNCPEIDWTEETYSNKEDHIAFKLLDYVQCNSITQLITESTHRRAQQRPTLIDLALTNYTNLVTDIQHHPPLGKSHHDVLILEVNTQSSDHTRNCGVTKYLFEKGDFNKIRLYMDNVNWKEYFVDTEPSITWWEHFYSYFNDAMKECIPSKTFKPNKKKRPFFAPPDLLNKVRLKRSAYKYYKKYPTTKNYNAYVRLRNQVHWGARKAKTKKERDIAKLAKTNPKAFFNYASSKLKTESSVPNLEKPNGDLTTNDTEKANVLNDFLSSVFTCEDANNIPNFDCGRNDIKLINNVSINEDMMLKALNSLDVSKSPGPDEVHPRVLKELATVLACPLTLLFNKSMSEGKLPYLWKQAEVRPIFKKGKKSNPGNYRPVSLTSILCKIFESFVRDALYSHFVNNQLLSDVQYGFCKGRSCVSQLLVTLQEWLENLDNKVPIDALYLDLSKAFDTVPHQRLISKLRGYGVTGNILNWITDFLKDRTQYVSVNGSRSTNSPVTSGVPQGSVLGPVLFIYYINDLPSVTHCSLKIFADDTKAFTTIKSTEDQLKLQKCLDNLTEWTDRWLLRFNSAKCKVLHLGENNPRYNYFIKEGNTVRELLETTSEKDLGVYIDPNLTFNDHIEITVKKSKIIIWTNKPRYYVQGR